MRTSQTTMTYCEQLLSKARETKRHVDIIQAEWRARDIDKTNEEAAAWVETAFPRALRDDPSDRGVHTYTLCGRRFRPVRSYHTTYPFYLWPLEQPEEDDAHFVYDEEQLGAYLLAMEQQRNLFARMFFPRRPNHHDQDPLQDQDTT